MIKMVIFDWAGTTIDYGCMAPVNAFYEAFAEQGIQPTFEEIREPMGMLKMDHIRYMLGKERIKQAWETLYNRGPEEQEIKEIYASFEEKLFENLAHHSQLKPDTFQAINALKEKEIIIGSTTGYTREMIDIAAATAAKQGYAPDTIVTPTEVDNYGRPYPYMVFSNMKAAGIDSVEQVVKVGDTLSDIQEGKQAGVKTIGVIEGSSLLGLSEEEFTALSKEKQENLKHTAREKFIQTGADYTIDTLFELQKLPLFQ
ncbi:phosphonoacetaldehyde hydrolase [Enterococcus faecalis 13-SD-W-01]|nr:phosphonoacetaldehyde hydrolase [Enterococcus faecalis 13-SD-W-01]